MLSIDPIPIHSEHASLMSLTRLACELTRTAAAATADTLAGGGLGGRSVLEAERTLDSLDREMDERVALAVGEVNPSEARDLLICMKFLIDLERIGDLLSSTVNCSAALGKRIGTQDMADLVRMATILETMLAEAQRALFARDLHGVLDLLRNDAEIDRLRNLILVRHLEGASSNATHDSIHVLFMAQSLERAGDHAKNLAEEVCHLVSGTSVRHSAPQGPSAEQMSLERSGDVEKALALPARR